MCGGMPKGRNEWAAEMYIKRSSVVLRVHGTHALRREEQTGKNRISEIISHQAEPSGLNIKQLSLIDFCILHFFAPKLVETAHQIHQPSSCAASLSPAPHPHIWATVHHGDQHGHAPCPSAAFGDGGVPPVSGHSLCLQGRTTRAPPPLRTVWHHRGGGGGLLHPGGGPSPALLPADRGEPEEEHQMRHRSDVCLTCLASVWRSTDDSSVTAADGAD